MKIGGLAKLTGVKAETIRFYEREGILPPPARTQGNYRDYGNAHAERLSFIRSARDLGFSMAQVRELLALADDASRSCAAVDDLATAHLQEVERKIARLSSLRDELARMLATCRQGEIADCRIIEVLGQGRAST